MWLEDLAMLQLWYRATVATSHWIHLDPLLHPSSNGWLQLWHGTTVAT